MKYFQFHLGDWESSTRYLSPLEKGIYLDLLTFYYAAERPLMRTQCERICRAYTDEEKIAFNYILETFFTEEADGFHNRHCDREIEAWNEKREKAKLSAKRRWERESKEEGGTVSKKAGKANAKHSESKSNANAMQEECERNANAYANAHADAMLTINHKPYISSSSSKEEKEESSAVEYSEFPYAEVVSLFSFLKKGIPEVIDDELKEQLEHAGSVLGADGYLPREEIIQRFAEYAELVKESDFLNGRTKRPYNPTLFWILGEENIRKVKRGDYTDWKPERKSTPRRSAGYSSGIPTEDSQVLPHYP